MGKKNGKRKGGRLIFIERHPPFAVNLNWCKLTDCQLRNLSHRSHLSIALFISECPDGLDEFGSPRIFFFFLLF
jgi:hypothetical protein